MLSASSTILSHNTQWLLKQKRILNHEYGLRCEVRGIRYEEYSVQCKVYLSFTSILSVNLEPRTPDPSFTLEAR